MSEVIVKMFEAGEAGDVIVRKFEHSRGIGISFQRNDTGEYILSYFDKDPLKRRDEAFKNLNIDSVKEVSKAFPNTKVTKQESEK